jgi:Helicase associated domain
MTCTGCVPTKWPQDMSLGRWVSMQRGQYKDFKAGRKTVMTKERIKLLQDIGFEWAISSRTYSLFANTSITNTQSDTIVISNGKASGA